MHKNWCLAFYGPFIMFTGYHPWGDNYRWDESCPCCRISLEICFWSAFISLLHGDCGPWMQYPRPVQCDINYIQCWHGNNTFLPLINHKYEMWLKDSIYGIHCTCIMISVIFSGWSRIWGQGGGGGNTSTLYFLKVSER